MSHQTGITASEDLRRFLATCKDGSIRLIKVAIENEELVLSKSERSHGSWEEDFDHLVQPLLEKKMPCYILYRLDSDAHNAYEWVFICYSPDWSPVRQKMLYAATRATLKKEFGGGQIKEELFGTDPADVSLESYRKHLKSQNAPPPLTDAEYELEEIKRNEVKVEGVDSKQQTLSGVAFPITEEALGKLQELFSGSLDYVQLSLDLEKEIINLETCESTDIHRLPSRIPRDHARYHFFVFKHTFEGDYIHSLVFIYSMPGYSCSIKERMLYSSCKGPLIDSVEQTFGLEIAKKIEIDDPSELTEEFVYNEVHPKKDIVRKKFDRPTPPVGRGPRRMTKSPAKPE